MLLWKTADCGLYSVFDFCRFKNQVVDGVY